MKHAKRILIGLLILLLAVAFTTACEKSYKKEKQDVVNVKQKEVDMNKKLDEIAKKNAEQKAEEAKKEVPIEQPSPGTDPECWGKPDPQAGKVAFTAGGHKYEIVDNYKLLAVDADETKPLVIGALTDIKSGIAKNLATLTTFFEDFKKAGVSVVTVTGDTAEKYADIKTVLEFLAKQDVLTLVIIGNRDKKEDYVKAIDEVSAANKQIVNMNKIRLADLGAVSVLSLPGYYDPNYIHHPPGCPYTATHIGKLQEIGKGVTDKLLLISHGPPMGIGKDAIDYAVEAGNVGDKKLKWIIGEMKIPFGIFGNIHEAGGKAVGSDLKTIIKADTPSANLYLNPGPADSDPWNMNDGSVSRGMAAIMTIKDGQAAYKILRAK